MKTINLATDTHPNNFVSKHWLVHPVGDDRFFVKVTGNVIVPAIKGTDDVWARAMVNFDVRNPVLPPIGKALFLENWTVVVTPTSIANQGTAVDAGWAVDEFGLRPTRILSPAYIGAYAKVAVRDKDGFLYRFAYDITMIFKIVEDTSERF